MRIPSNKVCDIERFAYQELEDIYNKNEIRTLLQMLFEHFLGWNVARLLISKNRTINQSDLLKFNFAIKDLRHGKPIQYIIGSTEFCDLTLSVSPHTLIPRPETAELVRKAVAPLVAEGADKIVLGCTHYPFLRDVIAKVAGEGVEIIDSSEAVARRVATLLDENNLRANENATAEYRFLTFADEAYAEKLREKAFHNR